MKNELLSLAVVIGVGAVIASTCIHKVDEGHVGLYWRGGALLNGVSHAGFNFKLPVITTFDQVQVSVQTDKVTDIPCGTSGGVVIHFEKIEVVNRLRAEHALDTVRKYTLNYDKTWIFDKIHHEINQFCSSHTLQEVYIDQFDQLDEMLAKKLQADLDKWAPGIEIIATRVTKPRIPKQIRDNYEQMEFEKTNLLISTERQKVIGKEAETDRLVAVIAAEKSAAVSKIQMEKELALQQAAQSIQSIDDSIQTEHRTTVADAAYYKKQKMAEGNHLKFQNKAFHFYELFRLIEQQPKVYFGKELNGVMDGVDVELEENDTVSAVQNPQLHNSPLPIKATSAVAEEVPTFATIDD